MEIKSIKIWPLLLLFTVILSCQKENIDTSLNTGIEFSLQNVTNSELKCTPVYELNRAKSIILTIKKEDGSPTNYTSAKIDVFKLGDAFICEKLLLSPGNYKLTEFLVADSLDNIIFAAPLDGSELASGVSDPLPIHFIIEKDRNTKILVEVLSTENVNSTQFGLAWFSVNATNLYYLQVALADKLTGKPLEGNIKIFTEDSNLYSETYPLEALLSNVIPIKKGLPNYYFETHSKNYDSKLTSITADSLETIITGEKPILIFELINNSVVLDVEGNVYKTVKIGSQTWMAENLKTTHLNDNSTIHHSHPGSYVFGNWCSYDFTKLEAPAYCKHFFTEGIENYGHHYNFYTVKSDKICPSGWHVPSETDWDTLINYLGGPDIAGDKLKDTIPKNWYGLDIGNATNESGFSAVGAGYLSCGYENPGNAIWWALGGSDESAISYSINPSQPGISKNNTLTSIGLKIRCIKDE
jgi:uncharacterized protein (TIGR02145 family)